MLHARVERPPDTDDIHFRNIQAFADPVRAAFSENIGPAPPAWWTHHPIVARAAVGVMSSLIRKRG